MLNVKRMWAQLICCHEWGKGLSGQICHKCKKVKRLKK